MSSLEQQAASLPQAAPSLPALCPAAVLPEILTWLLRNICGFRSLAYPLPSPPARCAPLTAFRIAQQSRPTIANRDRAGHLWVETDPLALLLNRSVVRSCQTVTSGKQERAGNFNFVYCPFMATLFAGAANPTSASSFVPVPEMPKYGPNRLQLFLRRHQASANVFLTYDKKGRLFLLVTRLWDSCAENPWTDGMLAYLEIECARLGLGLALSPTWLPRMKASQQRQGTSAAFLDRVGASLIKQTPLYTPGLCLPFRKASHLIAAGSSESDLLSKPLRADGAGTVGSEFIHWQRAGRSNWLRYGGAAHVMLQPTPADRLQIEAPEDTPADTSEAWQPWQMTGVLMPL